MSYSISKELFEAVMGFEVIEFYCRKEIQYYPADKERVRCIDWIPTLSGLEYNDFFFKCKEWAFEKGYDIYSDTHGADVCNVGSNYSIAPFHHSGSEQQACFDACQWILDNKDKQ